jgi:DNA-directed RNA polymerase specialized sigma24 family protein
MARHLIDLGPTTGPLDELLARVAARDHAAFSALFSRLVKPVFLRVRAALGDTGAAVAVTRAVFVEAWLRAPDAERGDALDWLSGIASRRVADRLRAINQRWPSSVDTEYEAHVGAELSAMLRPDAHAAFRRVEAVRSGAELRLPTVRPAAPPTGRHRAPSGAPGPGIPG